MRYETLFVTQKQFSEIHSIFADAYVAPELEAWMNENGVELPADKAAKKIASMFNLRADGSTHYRVVVVKDGDSRAGKTTVAS